MQEEFAEALAMKPDSMFVNQMFSVIDREDKGHVTFRDVLYAVAVFSRGERRWTEKTRWVVSVIGQSVLDKPAERALWHRAGCGSWRDHCGTASSTFERVDTQRALIPKQNFQQRRTEAQGHSKRKAHCTSKHVGGRDTGIAFEIYLE